MSSIGGGVFLENEGETMKCLMSKHDPFPPSFPHGLKGNLGGEYKLTEKMAGCILRSLRNSEFTVRCKWGPSAVGVAYGIQDANGVAVDKSYFKELGDDTVKVLANTIIHETVHTCGSLSHSENGNSFFADWLNELLIKKVDPADLWGDWTMDL
jgi:hypothetical protein